MTTNNNEKKRFGRRAGATAIWALFLIYIFNVMAWKVLPIDYFVVPAKFFTLGLLIVTGGLTTTDIINAIFLKK